MLVRTFSVRFRLILTGLLGIASVVVAVNAMGQLGPKLARDAREALGFIRVDNSSIWIAKFQYDKFKAGIELPSDVILVGEITKADVPVFKTLLAPYLDQKYLQTHPKPSWFKSDPDESSFTVELDSQGGDVVAALEIGRLFRKARVTTVVGVDDKCLSSCVFLLAGAVHRLFFGGPIGIHRPYSDDTGPTSFEALQSRTTQLGRVVSRFLKEMNIPNTLYEAMTRVAPEQIKILDRDELDLYGLGQDDPVFAELQRNAEARAVGLPMREYLTRKAAYDRCVEALFMRRIEEGKRGMSIEGLEEISRGKGECFNRFILKKSQR